MLMTSNSNSKPGATSPNSTAIAIANTTTSNSSNFNTKIVAFNSPMTALEVTQPVQVPDPSPFDPHTVFIHPPFTTFPESNRHPEGLSYNLMTANPEWFLDPYDFISSVSPRPNAVQYPVKLEPPRKKSVMALGVNDVSDSDEPRFRCTFCRKSYSGENGKSMWRRHVTKRHNIVLSSRRDVKKGSQGRRANSKYLFHTQFA